jgi:biopolymer transport protein ExbD
MAEISQNGAGRSTNGKVRVKKLSTRIDMTPMVDLAFLLLTFFILTTTLTKDTAMDLRMPEKADSTVVPPQVNINDVLQVALVKGGKVYWWIGENPKPVASDYSKTGLRKILLDKKARIPNLYVLIKPADDSKYQNLVDVLDEIDIVKIEKYCITDFTSDDNDFLVSKGI